MNKNGLNLFIVAYLSTLLLACSSHPEIKPYDVGQDTETFDSDDNVFASSQAIELPDQVAEEASAEEEPQIEAATIKETSSSDFTPVTEKSERKPASIYKNGYYVFSSNCTMKLSPTDESTSAGNVTKGKKLWLDAHNEQWLKAYKKSGTVYIPTSCVQ